MTPGAAVMPLYYHPLYTDGIDPSARFPRDRYRLLRSRLQRSPHRQLLEIREAPLCDRDTLLLAHDPVYVDRFLAAALEVCI